MGTVNEKGLHPYGGALRRFPPSLEGEGKGTEKKRQQAAIGLPGSHFLFCFSSFFLGAPLPAGATTGAATTSSSSLGSVAETMAGFSVP
jgi:hypothetical protein